VVIALNGDRSAFEASEDSRFGNVLYLGGKPSGCCMEAIGLYDPLHYEGSIDEVRISDIQRAFGG
jgi:hypothetical protein